MSTRASSLLMSTWSSTALRSTRAHQRVHVQGLDHEIDHPLGDALRQRLERVGHAFACRAQPVERIHGIKYDRLRGSGIIRQG